MRTSLAYCAIAVVANVSELSSLCLFAHWMGFWTPDINEVVLRTIEFNWYSNHFAIGHAGSEFHFKHFHDLNIWQSLSTFLSLLIWGWFDSQKELIPLPVRVSGAILPIHITSVITSFIYLSTKAPQLEFVQVLCQSLPTDRPKACWTWKVSGSVMGLLQKAAGASALVLETRLWHCLSSS